MKNNKYKQGFLLSMLTCMSLGITACSNNKDLELTGKYKYSPQTNNFYDESNFYGNVLDVEEVTSKSGKKKLYSKVTVEGDRGTVVTVKTKEQFNVGEEVLFKSSLNKKHSRLIKVNKPVRTSTHSGLAENQANKYYKDISKLEESKDSLYEDIAEIDLYKEFEKSNIKLH